MKKDNAWTQIEVILVRIGTNEKAIEEIKLNIKENYINKDQYEPIKKITYGLVTLILLAVVGALLRLVILS